MSPVFPARRRAEEFAALVEQRSPGRSGLRDHDLDRFLEIVEALRAEPAPQPRAEFVSSLRERLMVAAAAELRPAEESRLTLPARRPRDRRIAAAVGGLALVGATTSMAVAAQSALPGDVLYPLKRAMENIQTGVSVDEGERGQTLLANAEGRLAEVVTLSREGAEEPQVVADTLNVFTDQAIEASDLLLTDYESTGSEDSITQLQAFTADSLETLVALEPVIPEEARDELLRAAMVLGTIDQEAAKACPQCAGSGVLDFPAILQSVESSLADVRGQQMRSVAPGKKARRGGDQPTTGAGTLPEGVVQAPTTSAGKQPDGGAQSEPSDDPVGGLTENLSQGGNSPASGGGTVPGLPEVVEGLEGLEDAAEDVLPQLGQD